MAWLGASCFLIACGPPQLTLPQVQSTAVMTATRDGRDKVKVSLTWDLKTTPCGTITNLTGRIDSESAVVTAGAPTADMKGCDFPTLQLAPKSGTNDRLITFDDGRGTISMTVTTLEAPTASIVTMSHTLRVNDSVVWTFSGSGGDVGAWKIFFTPTSGDAATWAEGTGPIMSVGAMIPSSAANSSGTVGLSWKSLSQVRACSGAKSCSIDVGDQAAFAISVAP
ncbi:MAG: hypothetical protein QM817_25255 [Archangium sp.]